MITSTSNSQVKQAAALAKRAKERRQTGLFVVEGRKMYEEAPEDWVEKVYVTEHYIEEYGQPKGSCPWETVTEDVMRAMADTQTPQGILALVRQPRWKMEDVWRGERSYDREDYRDGCGFLIGNEARGLSDDAADLADCWVKIPMLGRVESLNAAVAASVLMYEAARQRRNG